MVWEYCLGLMQSGGWEWGHIIVQSDDAPAGSGVGRPWRAEAGPE